MNRFKNSLLVFSLALAAASCTSSNVSDPGGGKVDDKEANPGDEAGGPGKGRLRTLFDVESYFGWVAARDFQHTAGKAMSAGELAHTLRAFWFQSDLGRVVMARRQGGEKAIREGGVSLRGFALAPAVVETPLTDVYMTEFQKAFREEMIKQGYTGKQADPSFMHLSDAAADFYNNTDIGRQEVLDFMRGQTLFPDNSQLQAVYPRAMQLAREAGTAQGMAEQWANAPGTTVTAAGEPVGEGFAGANGDTSPLDTSAVSSSLEAYGVDSNPVVFVNANGTVLNGAEDLQSPYTGGIINFIDDNGASTDGFGDGSGFEDGG